MSILANKIKELGEIANVTAENYDIIVALSGTVTEVLGENYPVDMKRAEIKSVFNNMVKIMIY